MIDPSPAVQPSEKHKRQTSALVYSAFIAGLCSIVYELLIATTVSYFLGDSVRYFSLTIGLYMAAMGAGSYCSKYLHDQVLKHFVRIEIALAVAGGFSIPLLYLSYATESLFVPTYVALTVLVGFLIGMEIPLLTRMMESFQSLKANIANILTFDYIGALIATLAFPFVLLPFLGNYKSSLVLGLINLSIIAVLGRFFDKEESKGAKQTGTLLLVGSLLIGGLVFASQALHFWDQQLYDGRIVHAEQSRYQKIVLTKEREDVRLYLNGNIQFSSVDEHRYHEALVNYPLAFKPGEVSHVLLLGAGDGLAVRQLLAFDEVASITLVDLDEQVVALAKSNPHLSTLNQGSLDNDRLSIVHTDAFSFLQNNAQPFDVIIGDLPDPNDINLARLYSRQFYRLIAANLKPQGMFVTQSTSPYFAKKAFWSIVKTLEASGLEQVVPYHVDVPSFGDWGFVMASNGPIRYTPERNALEQSRYLTAPLLTAMQVFGRDQMVDNVEVNNLDRPVLLGYYLEGWQAYGY